MLSDITGYLEQTYCGVMALETAQITVRDHFPLIPSLPSLLLIFRMLESESGLLNDLKSARPLSCHRRESNCCFN